MSEGKGRGRKRRTPAEGEVRRERAVPESQQEPAEAQQIGDPKSAGSGRMSSEVERLGGEQVVDTHGRAPQRELSDSGAAPSQQDSEKRLRKPIREMTDEEISLLTDDDFSSMAADDWDEFIDRKERIIHESFTSADARLLKKHFDIDGNNQ